MTHRQQLITSVKESVLEIAPGAEITLFGSRSRGDYREESDWDFLILTDQPATDQFKKKIRSRLFEVELKKIKLCIIVSVKVDKRKGHG